MKAIVLAAKRRWSWKVFFALAALLIPAVFAILPFELARQNAYTGSDAVDALGWGALVIDRLINLLLVLVLGGAGLMLANRIGLGMPFVEGRIKGERPPFRFRQVAAIAWIAAVTLVVSSLLLHALVFDPALNAMLSDLGITVPDGAPASPMQGLFASLSAAVTEETLFRLFGVSLLAWLIGLLFHNTRGIPRPGVFWAATVIFALAFGAAHLPTAAALGLPMNALVIASHLILNGIGGLVFGWLFCRFGLECAMLAHFFSDLIVYSLIPLSTTQSADAARYAVLVCVIAALLLALIWACSSLSTRTWLRAAPATSGRLNTKSPEHVTAVHQEAPEAK